MLMLSGKEPDAGPESTERGVDSGRGNLLVLLKSFVASVFLSLFSTLWVLIGQNQSKEVPSVFEYLTVVWEEKVRWAGGSQTCKGMSPHKTPYVTVLIVLLYYLV